MASRITGNKKLRRTLRRIDPSATRELHQAIEDTAEAIKQDQIAGAPVDEGDMVREISVKKGRDGLTAVIGPGAKSISISKNPFIEARKGIRGATKKHRVFQFMKAYWIEFGTKGGNGSPALPPRPFVQPAFDLNRAYGLRRIRQAIKLALERASR
jgi:hypothetical protein